ncbi:MAG: ribosome silencing factor [Myxococcota bacterium]
MIARDLALAAATAAIDKKGLDPVLIDVSGQSSYADYLLLVSGRSERQVQGLADAIADALAPLGAEPLGVEGRGSHWVVLDYADVVVHLFHHPVRDFFDLEGLWIDAPRVALRVPAESRLSAADAY